VLPDVPLRNVMTMEELIAKRVAQRRLNMLLLGLFGFLSLVISAAGIYGLMAFVVAQRTREIGVRIALGATRSHVVRMVVFNAATLVGSGLIIGGIAAWYLSTAAKAFLFGIAPTDARAFLAAVLLLAGAALVASVIPARRAASVDPMVALRGD
jgi:putative ABC transport system permease protein